MVMLQMFLTLFTLLLAKLVFKSTFLIMTLMVSILGMGAMLNFIKSWNHILLMLLTLEILTLANLNFLALLISRSSESPEILFTLFTLAVCEASLGVSILVYYSRSFGNDFLSSASLN